MTNLGDSFAWAFRDPAWPGKMLLQGLITIIPIIGWIAMVGWMLLAFENARSGKNELPPAGFHLARGIGLFLVFLIYMIVLNVPGEILGAAGAIAAGNSHQVLNFGSPLLALSYLWGFVASLFLRFLEPAIIVNSYHRGFAGGLDVGKVWRDATANVSNSIIGGLVIFASSVIGTIGFFCCIGFIFTVPYENTITAGAASWFEKQQGAAPAPTAVTPTA